MKDVMVSVIMPAYNAEKYIEQAIQSVLAQQVPLELIIIDDCSLDATVAIVERFLDYPQLILMKNEENRGVAESRNRGIRLAKGKYIAFLDADDWWSDNKLKTQVDFLEQKQGILCATARELMNADGSSTGKIIAIPEEITYQMLLSTNSIPCASVLVKTETAREFYMCHDELHEDYILWLQILKKYKKAYGINQAMLKCRMSEGGKSRNKFRSAKMQYGVYRYLGFGRCKSWYYFVQYAMNGIRKYS